MTRYFFDFKTDGAFANDEEGMELPDVEAAHDEDRQILLGELIVIREGTIDQHFSVEVRDELGPVLKLTALIGSTILRKQ